MSSNAALWKDILENWTWIPPSSQEADDLYDSHPTTAVEVPGSGLTNTDVHEQSPTIPPYPPDENSNISEITHSTSDGLASTFSDLESLLNHSNGSFSMSQFSHISQTFPSSVVQAPNTDCATTQRQDHAEDSPNHADASLHAEDAIVSTASDNESYLSDWTSAASQPLSQEKDSKDTAASQDVPLPSRPGRSGSGSPSNGLYLAHWVHGITPRRKAALKAEQRIATQMTALSSCDAEAAHPVPSIPSPKKRRRTVVRPVDAAEDADADVRSFPEASSKRRRISQRTSRDGYNPMTQDASPEISEHTASSQHVNDIHLNNIRSPRDFARVGDYRRYAYSRIHGPVLCSFCFEDPERSNKPGTKSRKKSQPDRSRTLSRLPDVGYRHLKTCNKFMQSKYFKQKMRRPRATQRLEDIVKDAVAKAHMMVVRLPCRRNPAYLARLALFQGIRAESVERHAAKHATIFKLDDCKCCPYPLYSAKAVQKLGRRGAKLRL
ncbi:hypothetical protein PYCCODRAFT_1459135 [Trametes coccinea BRFM310]|uniref:Uncharacterized protein n=1 Tax=Trametes coccinea (strain BRFM310) TaxID=1353009 RepID=A0A1Y2IP89_TRAC3|nr:hypothetical protein PYCCODRAFT_1459135 [Trametes coccinea BRFM310]